MKSLKIRSMALAVGCLLAGPVSGPAEAGTVTFLTPSGSTTDHPVETEAVFTTSAGQLTIALYNLEANPTAVTQALSGLSFTVSGSDSFDHASLSSSAQQVTIDKDGNPTPGSTGPTGWNSTLSGNSGYLDALGTSNPNASGLLIGGPDGSGVYSQANGSIAGNKGHNPFLSEYATFTITASGITADSTITAVSFSFGTTEGKYVIDGKMGAVPEPGALVLGALGLGVAGAAGLCRQRRRVRAAAA